MARWNTERMFRPEPEGLRVTIPGGSGKHYQVGIASRFRVRGDFEITASYEVLKADPARDGFGLGVNLAVEADSSAKVTLILENSDVPPRPGRSPEKTGRVFNATLVSGPPDGRKYSPGPAPAKIKAGTLRITRVGSTACAWYTEDGPTFRLLRQVEIGPEELSEVFVGANAGGSGHALDLRIHDLRIRAEELPGYAGTPLSSPPSPWRIVALGAGILLVAGATLWWIAAARRRASASGDDGQPGGAKKAPPAAKPGPAGIWDEEGLRRLEEKARAFAEKHPNAGALAERPRFQFTLRGGVLNGPFIAWYEVDSAAIQRLGKTWDEIQGRLPKRFEGEYRAGKRHGTFTYYDGAGGSAERQYRDGERVG